MFLHYIHLKSADLNVCTFLLTLVIDNILICDTMFLVKTNYKTYIWHNKNKLLSEYKYLKLK